AEDGIRDYKVTGVQTCALPIFTLRKEHHATRPTIEPLHQIRGRGVSCDLGVEVRLVRMMHPLLDDDAGRLVDEDERVVLEEDVRSEERRVGKEWRNMWVQEVER